LCRVVRLHCFGSMAGNAGELEWLGAHGLHARRPVGTRSRSSSGEPNRPLPRREARAGVAKAEPPPDLRVAATRYTQPTNWQLCACALPCSSARRRAPDDRQGHRMCARHRQRSFSQSSIRRCMAPNSPRLVAVAALTSISPLASQAGPSSDGRPEQARRRLGHRRIYDPRVAAPVRCSRVRTTDQAEEPWRTAGMSLGSPPEQLEEPGGERPRG
jgi:hypothetical protein